MRDSAATAGAGAEKQEHGTGTQSLLSWLVGVVAPYSLSNICVGRRAFAHLRLQASIVFESLYQLFTCRILPSSDHWHEAGAGSELAGELWLCWNICAESDGPV